MADRTGAADVVIRRHLFALLLLAGMAAMLFAPALARQEVFTFRDHVDYFQPLRWFTASELREGRLPLWNPYNAAGEPWLANPQTGVFYPPSWLFLALPFPAAYMAYLLLHVVLLGWGAYLLFSRDVSREAAMVGAAGLMFAGPVLSMLDISNNLATFAWIPFVLVAARLQKPIVGGAFLALAFLAGEPFLAAVAALLFVLLSRRVRVIAIAAVTSIGISAVQLLPFLDLLVGSDRAAGLDPKQVLRDSMPLREWLRLAIPGPLGTLDPALSQRFLPVVYCGAIVAILAVAGIVTAARSRRALLAWCGLAAVAAAIAAGPELLLHLPLTLFRYPARLVALAALAVAALASIGWDAVRPARRWVDLLLVLAIAADLLLHARPLLTTRPFTTALPHGAEVGRDSLFLRLDDFDGDRRSWMFGYLNLYGRRFDAYTAAPVLTADYQRFYAALLQRPSPFLLNAAAIGHVLATRTLSAPFALEGQSRRVRVYRVPGARPLAAAWLSAERSPSAPQALDTLLNGALQWPVAGLATTLAGRPAKPVAGEAEITTSQATVTVETNAPALVVLAQRDGRGWSAEVDGKPAAKLQAGGLFRAVVVGPGRHVIVWKYAPVPFFVGVLLTLITLLGVGLRVFVKHRHRSTF